MSEWQPIETCPENRIVILFAVTSDGSGIDMPNWKMATGDVYRSAPEHPIWTWDGKRLEAWDVVPTHWMPLPERPK